MSGVEEIILDTLSLDKQAIVFVNSKRSAESQAENISKQIKTSNELLEKISDSVLKALSNPTKQCKRLALCIKKGIAFHHAGLSSIQRDLVEEGFRNRVIKVIVATPTLAIGVDLPAFRVIIRDLKRYSGFGMQYIPVLEYHQQAGRAGRPSFDSKGEAIIIAKDVIEREELWQKYVNGKPENIYSKLAVEPVLRIYVLSLISGGFVKSFDELFEFMGNTFYAHQYGDMDRLKVILVKTIKSLVSWDFLEEFEGEILATRLGSRVSELYLDPYTANYLLENYDADFDDFSLLQLICWTLEMRPLMRTRKAEENLIFDKIVNSKLLVEEPDSYSDEFEEFLHSVKTASVLVDWMSEVTEEKLYEKWGCAPGELNAKLERGNWLLYSLYELLKIRGYKNIGRILRIQTRLKAGVKEELLALLRLKNIGRVRARKLYDNKICDLGDVKKADMTSLTQILGEKLAVDVKAQLGIVEKPVKLNKRKGQINLNDFS